MFNASTCHPIQRAQSQGSERRKSQRWKVQVPVTLSGAYGGEGTICNLSTGGCAIHTMSSYHHDADVQLVFVLPGAGQVIIRATVRWASWPFLGLGFSPEQDQAKLAVCSYLDQLMQRQAVKGIAIY